MKQIRIDAYYQRRYVVSGAPWGVNIYRGRELIAKGHGPTKSAAVAAARDSRKAEVAAGR